MNPKYIQPQDVTEQNSEAQVELGAIRWTYDTTNGLRKWKYVQFDNGSGNVASATNMVVYYLVATVTGGKVTNDVSDSDINHVAGVMPVSMTDLYYGWMQIGGYNSAIRANGDDDIAAADALIGGGDGTCNSVAQDTAPTNKVLGFSWAADVDASNTVAGMITVGEF